MCTFIRLQIMLTTLKCISWLISSHAAVSGDTANVRERSAARTNYFCCTRHTLSTRSILIVITCVRTGIAYEARLDIA